MPHQNRFARLVLTVGLLMTLLIPQPGQAVPSSTVLTPESLAHIEQHGALLWFGPPPDLSPAAALGTRAEKARFVFASLQAAAGQTQAGVKALLDRRGVAYQSFSLANVLYLPVASPPLLQELARRPEILGIYPNKLTFIPETLQPMGPAGPEEVEPNLAFINADEVWALGFTGQGVTIGVIGTGLDETHPAIAPQYRGCLNPPDCTSWDHNYNWWDAVSGLTNPYDDNGHGTMVTGVSVGDDWIDNQIGVAPRAWTIACKALSGGGFGTDADILECLQWLWIPWDLNGGDPNPALAPDIVTLTWGHGADQPWFQAALDNLIWSGILVTVPVGNNGPACGSVSYPASYPELLTIGAGDSTGGGFPGTLFTPSSRGPSLDYPEAYFPDVIAPGVNIRSSYPGNDYEVWSGTALPTSQASGLVALCWSANPALNGNIDATFEAIYAGAGPLTGQHYSDCGGDYDTGPNNDWGYGMIDALATVNACLGLTPPGTLQGTVTDTATSEPVDQALLTALDPGGYFTQTLTGPSGDYELILPVGTYTVTAQAEGFEAVTAGGVVITAGGVTIQDFALPPLMPDIVVDPLSISQTLYISGTAWQTFHISNTGEAPLSYAIVELFPAAWLGISPPSGNVQPGFRVDTLAFFDAAGLAPGTYTTTLAITSNDPDEPVTEMGVALTVLAIPPPLEPEIVVVPTAISLTVRMSETLTSPLVISNTGTADLNWVVLEGSPWLGLDPAFGTVPPAGFAALTLTVEAGGLVPGLYEASFKVASNDPDSLYVTVTVHLDVLEPCIPITDVVYAWAPELPLVGEVVTFTAAATGTLPITFTWELEDELRIGALITDTFEMTGTYLVTLTVENACQAVWFEFPVVVQPQPVWEAYLPLILRE